MKLEKSVPNRYSHATQLSSESLTELSAEEERLFHRLILFADDWGRFDARGSVMAAGCYPTFFGRITIEQVMAWLKRLADPEIGIVELYEVDGKPYGHFCNWWKYQRARDNKSKHPAPTCGDLRQVAAGSGKAPLARAAVEDEDVVEGRITEDEDDARAGEPQQVAAKGLSSSSWLKIISQIEELSEGQIETLEEWSLGHDPQVLLDTANDLAQKWDPAKANGNSPFSTYPKWVKLAEERLASSNGRSPPSRASPKPDTGIDYPSMVPRFDEEDVQGVSGEATSQ